LWRLDHSDCGGFCFLNAQRVLGDRDFTRYDFSKGYARVILVGADRDY